MSLIELAQALGHRFDDEKLLKAALTHRSYGADHNERLEFLGDSLLNCIVAAELFRRFPQLPEGDLSRLRANLVCQDSLHQIARGLNLGQCLRLGEGEVRSGGRMRPSILADALEALIGSIYLDGGFAAVSAAVNRLYASLYEGLMPGDVAKDPKTRLQEWLQARRKPLPKYVLLETTGAAHEQCFEVACELASPTLRLTGQGSSRRIAEQVAAENALKALNA